MRYHVFKQTRIYEGEPYTGYSMELIGHVDEDKAESDDLKSAIRLARSLQEANPVGWNVFDSTTGKCVHGFDLFSDVDEEQ